MPAEWEPHDATWLAWPHSDDWPGKLQAVRWVFCEIIRHLQRGERICLLVNTAQAGASAKQQLKRAGVDVHRVQFVVAPTDRSWTRDNLPLFVTCPSQPRVGAVKWRFNAWARYPEYRLDDAAGKHVAERHADLCWKPRLQVAGRLRHVVLEGGSVDVDGQGTLLTTRRCLLGHLSGQPYARNPGVTQSQLEELLAAYLGARRVIWLEDGIAGDDTSGHIDDFARFVAPGRVVLVAPQSEQDPNAEALAQAKQVLEGSRDAQGRRLEVVDLPSPSPIFFDGEQLPASYANFYIGNECVLVPTFNDSQDRSALSVLAELFPERRIVGIHCSDLVLGLGAIHCSTQQQPSPELGQVLEK